MISSTLTQRGEGHPLRGEGLQLFDGVEGGVVQEAAD